MHDSFIDKHIWKYDGNPVTATEEEVKTKLESLERYVNTFLATQNKDKTLRAIYQITNYYFEKGYYDDVFDDQDRNNVIMFDSFKLRDIHAVLIHATYYDYFKCWYALTGDIVVSAFTTKNRKGFIESFEVHHLNTRPKKDGFHLSRCQKNKFVNDNNGKCHVKH